MWIKLLKEWSGHAVGTELHVEQIQADELVTSGTASKITQPAAIATMSASLVEAVVRGVALALPAALTAAMASNTSAAAAGAAGATGQGDQGNQGNQGNGTQAATLVRNLSQMTPGPSILGAFDPETDVGFAFGGPGTVIEGTHDLALDDPSGGFRLFSDFAVSVRGASRPTGRPLDERLVRLAATGMNEGVDDEGGWLIPPQHLQRLLKLAWQRAALASRTQGVPMQSNQIDMPALRNTNRTKGNRNGGIQVYWVAEAAAKTASQPKFDKIGLKLNEMAGLVYVTNTLLEDSPISLEPLLGGLFAEEFALETDDAIYAGTGAGQPLGILNAPCLVSVTAEAGQAAATILTENIINMWARMWPPSRARAVWVINTDILPQLMTLVINVGTGGMPVFMPPNGLVGAPYGTIFGRPVVETEQCKTLGTQGDIALCDFGYYLLGQKVTGIQAATSIHLKFNYDETAFRYVMRLDGQPWLNAAITPMNGTNTLSPFVVLDSRT